MGSISLNACMLRESLHFAGPVLLTSAVKSAMFLLHTMCILFNFDHHSARLKACERWRRMRVRRNITRAAWRLAKCYWTSEEKWSAWALLIGVIGLNLGNVYISVRINEWNRSFYNALQAFDSGELFRQLGIFCILVFFAISMSVYGLYLSQMLQIRWRRWLTGRYLDSWLAERAYYQLELGGRTDNPDQRIAEDLNQFTTFVLESLDWA